MVYNNKHTRTHTHTHTHTRTLTHMHTHTPHIQCQTGGQAWPLKRQFRKLLISQCTLRAALEQEEESVVERLGQIMYHRWRQGERKPENI